MSVRKCINAVLLQECLSDLKQLFFGNIKCALIKGEPLSYYAYGEFGKRDSADIDILVAKKDIRSVEQYLESKGFNSVFCNRQDRLTMLATSHQVSPWVKEYYPWGTVTIDLNFDVFWGEYDGKRQEIDDFLKDIVEMEIYGCKVKTLSPLKTFIQLSLHHYKDLNSIYLMAVRKQIRKRIFEEVYYLLKNNSEEINLNTLYSECLKMDIVPFVFYILYYVDYIYDDELLKKFVKAFKTKEGENLLECYGLCAKERKRWKYDFDSRCLTDNLFAMIESDLSNDDYKKIKINKAIFG